MSPNPLVVVPPLGKSDNYIDFLRFHEVGFKKYLKFLNAQHLWLIGPTKMVYPLNHSILPSIVISSSFEKVSILQT